VSRPSVSQWRRYGLSLFERGLPLFAGAALALGGGGAFTLATGLGAGAAWVMLAALGTRSRGAALEGLCFGLAPVLLGHALAGGAIEPARPWLVGCLAVPFAVYAANPALVAGARAGSPMLFGLLNALALAALAPAVIGGHIHWAIAILPFAVFRVAAETADKIRPGDTFERSRAEAADVAQKMLWVGGTWLAGWAGIPP